eukprot:14406769-Ditylum_brightwellii.AAC.1
MLCDRVGRERSEGYGCGAGSVHYGIVFVWRLSVETFFCGDDAEFGCQCFCVLCTVTISCCFIASSAEFGRRTPIGMLDNE